MMLSRIAADIEPCSSSSFERVDELRRRRRQRPAAARRSSDVPVGALALTAMRENTIVLTKLMPAQRRRRGEQPELRAAHPGRPGHHRARREVAEHRGRPEHVHPHRHALRIQVAVALTRSVRRRAPNARRRLAMNCAGCRSRP